MRPPEAMSIVFRAKYLQALRERIPGIDKKLLNALFKKPWVVYAKRPFANTKFVIEYLGRYTHKIAISNHRIKNIDEQSITFTCKDYRNGGRKYDLTMDGIDFIRRFSMHILPKGFVRIRHYGILCSTCKKTSLPLIREQLPAATPVKTEPRIVSLHNPKLCPVCKPRCDGFAIRRLLIYHLYIPLMQSSFFDFKGKLHFAFPYMHKRRIANPAQQEN